MAKIRVEQKKKSVWPWIIAAIVVLLLLWALVAMLGRDERAAVPVGADQTAAPMTTPAPVTAPATTAPADEALARYAGEFTSVNLQLNLDADGTYTMQESPAGQGQGRWTHDASANALHLTPADGSQDRYFRVEGPDTLVPLNPDGEPAAQMAPLQRRADS